MKSFEKLLLLLFFAQIGYCGYSQESTSGLSLYEKLKNLKSVVSVDTLERGDFKEKYVVKISQPLDHHNPSKGNFLQRFVVGHIDPDSVTVMTTEGYSGDRSLRPKYREELSKLFNTNMVFVEHRYFSESTPEDLNWDYLTAENSAYDLHKINNIMKELYPERWIATGISKGGQTAILYRTYFPNDVDISVPYVAPVCFGVEDGRHEPFICKVDGYDKLLAFQREVLSRRKEIIPLLDAYSAKKGYEYRIPLNEILDYSVLEYPFAFHQRGRSLYTIPSSDVSTDSLFNNLMKVSGPDYFDIKTEIPSFFVQAARELGYYGYYTEDLEDKLTIKSSKDYLRNVFLPQEAKGIKFSDNLHLDIYKYLQYNDPKMIFIYGETDPWTAAAVDDKLLVGKNNMYKFVETSGSHSANISTLSASQRARVLEILRRWLYGIR